MCFTWSDINDLFIAHTVSAWPFLRGIVSWVIVRAMELKPEKDCWQRVAREWYIKVIAELPGHGKLHHHLGLLSREEPSPYLLIFLHDHHTS
jgi:hypothetical protein